MSAHARRSARSVMDRVSLVLLALFLWPLGACEPRPDLSEALVGGSWDVESAQASGPSSMGMETFTARFEPDGSCAFVVKFAVTQDYPFTSGAGDVEQVALTTRSRIDVRGSWRVQGQVVSVVLGETDVQVTPTYNGLELDAFLESEELKARSDASARARIKQQERSKVAKSLSASSQKIDAFLTGRALDFTVSNLTAARFDAVASVELELRGMKTQKEVSLRLTKR